MCVMAKPTLPAQGGPEEVGPGPTTPGFPGQATPPEGSALCQHPAHWKCPKMKQSIFTGKDSSAEKSRAVHLAFRKLEMRKCRVKKATMNAGTAWRQRENTGESTTHGCVRRSSLLLKLETCEALVLPGSSSVASK